MKRMLFTLASLLIVSGVLFAVQPVRKPFVKINVNGEEFLDGDILEVQKGGVTKIKLSLQGGRRDFVKFPDIYADIPSGAQVIYQNENLLVYQVQNERYEWKLLDQWLSIEKDQNISIREQRTQANEYQVWINVPPKTRVEPFVKFTIMASWKYTDEFLVMEDEDLAEATLYLQIKENNNSLNDPSNVKVSQNLP